MRLFVKTNARPYSAGFTLPELLIALLILGEIATFTIPKIITAQQKQQAKASGKEVIAMISGAYSIYSIDNAPNANTRVTDLTPYMNYLAVDATSSFDNVTNDSKGSCSNAIYECLKLHNGGLLTYTKAVRFNGTTANNALYYRFDPDGKATTGERSLGIFIYFNGRVTTYATIEPNTVNNDSSSPFNPAPDPSWFSW